MRIEGSGVVAPQEQQGKQNQARRLEQVGVPRQARRAPAGGQDGSSVALQRPPHPQRAHSEGQQHYAHGSNNDVADGESLLRQPAGAGDLLGHPADMAGALAGQETAVEVVQGGEPGRGSGDPADLVSGGGVDRVGRLPGPDLDDIVDPGGGGRGLVWVMALDRRDGLG